MSQLGESITVTTITDPAKPHWVQVEYKYSNGKPVKGTYRATDSEGLTWAGVLNDKGQACLSNVPPGSVEFELVSEDMEDELKHIRTNIKAVLDAIVAEQKAEAAQYERELARQNTLEQIESHRLALRKGFWNGALGLITFAKDAVIKAAEIALYLSPLERLNNLLHAAYKSYHSGALNSAQWKQSLVDNLKDEELKDIARILGIDVKYLSPEGLQQLKILFAEAYEITAFIADDAESLDMLTQFGKDYAGAQSSVEWAEFAGGGVFEIVLTALLLMFTGGIGNVAQGASKIRHAGKLRSLGSIFRNLGKLLKLKKLHKKTRVSVDSKKLVTAKLPQAKKVLSKPKEKLKPNTPEHKKDRWKKYQDKGGEKSYEEWSKQYDTNMRNYQYGAAREADYRKAMNASEGTLKTPLTNRQIDILNKNEMYAGQLKTGPVSLTKENALAIQKDATLVKKGWQVEHILEKGASKPYLDALEKAGIDAHIGPKIP